MPMFLTNRSIPVLYYLKENQDGSIEYISSSRDTDEIAEKQAKLIGKNVIGKNVVNYTKLTPTPDGVYWQSVLCVDICGSVPDALKR